MEGTQKPICRCLPKDLGLCFRHVFWHLSSVFFVFALLLEQQQRQTLFVNRMFSVALVRATIAKLESVRGGYPWDILERWDNKGTNIECIRCNAGGVSITLMMRSSIESNMVIEVVLMVERDTPA